MADISLDLRAEDGRTIDAMAQIIKTRARELGETTAQACAALAINVLKSIRAVTKVANEKSVNIEIKCVDGQYWPSWRKRGKYSERVLRAGENGHVVEDKKVFWLCGTYVKKEQLHSFVVKDRISDEKSIEILVVARNAGQAKEWMAKRHKNRVKRYKMLAKHALSIAMHRVSSAESANEGVTQEAKAKGMECVNAVVRDSGFGTGEVSIRVHDKLRYASYALKGGESVVEQALQKALNGMTGYLKKKLKDKGIEDTLKIPFPEIKGKK